MRVTIERKTETTGLVFKEAMYCVYATVEFTEEEKHIIYSTGLRDYEFYNPPLHARGPLSSDVSPEEAMKHGGPVFALLNETWTGKPKAGTKTIALARCKTEALANIEEGRIREALTTLKAVIDRHGQPVKAKDTFEL